MPRTVTLLLTLVAAALLVLAGTDLFVRVLGLGSGSEERAAQEAPPPAADSLSPEQATASAGKQALRQAVVARNLFGSQPAPVENGEPLVEVEKLEPTKLRLALLGTIADQDNSGRAIILDESQRSQALYRVGEKVQEAEIREILRGKVVLRVDGRDEVLEMSEKPSSASPAPLRPRPDIVAPPSVHAPTAGPQGMSRTEIDQAVGNMGDVLSQVRLRPYFRNGEVQGVIVSQIRRGSIFANIGLRNGDVLQSVNGVPVAGPDEIMALVEGLQAGDQLDIGLLRQGREETLNYTIR